MDQWQIVFSFQQKDITSCLFPMKREQSRRLISLVTWISDCQLPEDVGDFLTCRSVSDAESENGEDYEIYFKLKHIEYSHPRLMSGVLILLYYLWDFGMFPEDFYRDWIRMIHTFRSLPVQN